MVEDLLQESNLTLATTIAKCQSREAAKKHRTEMVMQGTDVIAALHKPQQSRSALCPGCGGAHHREGHSQCPAFDQICSFCHKVGHFARICRSKHKQPASTPATTPQISANAIRVQSQQGNHIQLYNIVGNKTEPAPTIVVHMSSSSGIREVKVLPDSGADISAAGQEILGTLGQHIDNLLPSNISPRAVNGSCMTPVGKTPVTI